MATWKPGCRSTTAACTRAEALYRQYQAAPAGPEKEVLRQKWKDAGGEQTQRLFVGRTRGDSSALILADAAGRPRIVMTISPGGEPALDFMDDQGNVIQSLPQAATAKR